MRRPLAIALALIPAAAAAANTTASFTLVSEYTINNGPGTQTDPHVSGDLVAYTNISASGGNTGSEVRVATLGGTEVAIPNAGNQDRFSDISGSRVVFTRVNSLNCSSISLYDVATQQVAELSPDPNACLARDHAAIGGGTVAWVDAGLANGSTEIVVFDLAAQQAARLTNDNLNDLQPAVAPDGHTVAWTSCQPNMSACEIRRAERGAAGTWTVSPTRISGEQPATDGTILVYQRVGKVDRDLWYQPLGGGQEIQVPLTDGVQQNASVAGGLIAFESRPSGLTENFDIWLYDTATGRRYQLTFSPDDERLSDIDVDAATGEATVVYTRNENGNENIYALRFHPEAPAMDPCDSAAGEREILATLTLTREKGAPNTDHVTFISSGGSGVICVQNGSSKESAATTGKVTFNGKARFGSSDFKKSVAWLEDSVDLQPENVLWASIGGEPGTTYTVTVYGPLKSTSTGATTSTTKQALTNGCSSSASAPLLALVFLVALALRIGRSKRTPATVRSRQ